MFRINIKLSEEIQTKSLNFKYDQILNKKSRVLKMSLDLEKIQIENFYSYKNVIYDNFKNYNVIIGKNKSGKSNLFKLFNLLKRNTDNSDFKVIDIYDEDLELDNKIALVFSINHQLRAEIFSILYDGKYLSRAIEYHSRAPNKYKDYQPFPQWKNKDETLEWLLAKGLFNKLSIDIEYDKKQNFLCIRRISVYHSLYNTHQTLFELQYENNRGEAFILNLEKFVDISRSIEGLFRLKELKKLPYNTTFNLGRTIHLGRDNDSIKQHIPILEPILNSLLDNFFNAIQVIPAKRIFDSDSDRDEISGTTLDLNGKNLVKFIHKKAAKQQWEWLKEWNSDLKHFLDDIEELKQDVKGNNRSTLILKENGLNMDIPLESMGSGILNIAHFLAYIKTLDKPSIICIEEPELHLHPGLERELRNEFIRKSENHQIFITTHSREFLDDNEEKCSIYLISKREDCSNVKKISNEDYKEIYRDLELTLSQYEESNKTLTDNEFWRNFITKAMEKEKYETEFWDFKEFLEIWKTDDPQVKRKKKIDFCGHIASFANNKGGVLILGISDKTPRELKGLNNIETKMNHLNEFILKFIEYPNDFTFIKSISLTDSKGGSEIDCILIVIAQTKEGVAVKDDNNNYSYFYRITSGRQKRSPREIKELKKEIVRDNYKFLNNLREEFQI